MSIPRGVNWSEVYLGTTFTAGEQGDCAVRANLFMVGELRALIRMKRHLSGLQVGNQLVDAIERLLVEHPARQVPKLPNPGIDFVASPAHDGARIRARKCP